MQPIIILGTNVEHVVEIIMVDSRTALIASIFMNVKMSVLIYVVPFFEDQEGIAN